MSGGRAFDPPRFVAVARHLLTRRPMRADTLAWMMMRVDFDWYRQEGVSLTGATYLRGEHHPEVDEIGVGGFHRLVEELRPPRWARMVGRAAVAATIVTAIRR